MARHIWIASGKEKNKGLLYWKVSWKESFLSSILFTSHPYIPGCTSSYMIHIFRSRLKLAHYISAHGWKYVEGLITMRSLLPRAREADGRCWRGLLIMPHGLRSASQYMVVFPSCNHPDLDPCLEIYRKPDMSKYEGRWVHYWCKMWAEPLIYMQGSLAG